MKDRTPQILARRIRLHLIIAFIPVFSAIESDAQTLQRQSIASSGMHALSGGIHIAQTIGQPYGTAPYSKNGIACRPGFQQPLVFKTEFIHSTINVALNVYPNPATSSVTIESQEVINSALIHVKDKNGNPLINEKIEGLSTYSINCETWAPGFYFITIYDKQSNNQYSSKLIITK
jgi:hypothetical protein